MSVATRQHMVLARDFFERGQYPDAIREIREAIQLNPGFPDLHQQLGLALSMSGERELAVDEFRRALHLNPNYVEARLNLAIVLNDLGRYDEALHEFHMERPRDPDHENLTPEVRAHLAESHTLLGDTYRNLGLLVDASQEYRKALRAAPQFLDIKNKLGSVYAEMGLDQDAEPSSSRRSRRTSATWTRASRSGSCSGSRDAAHGRARSGTVPAREQ